MRKSLKTWLRKNYSDFYWSLQIPFFANAIPAHLPSSVLFVCKGNICRSPFAEHLANKLAAQCRLTKMSIASAGLRVIKPLSPPEQSITAARFFGLDLSQHLSQSLDEKMVDDFNMIIVMEPSQLKALSRAFPRARKKIFLLRNFGNKGKILNHDVPRYTIPDPFGKSEADFNACFKIIEDCVVQLFSRDHPCLD